MTDDEIKRFLGAYDVKHEGVSLGDGGDYDASDIRALAQMALEARAEIERLTAERDQARKDAVALGGKRYEGIAVMDDVIERLEQYEADERAKGGGRG